MFHGYMQIQTTCLDSIIDQKCTYQRKYIYIYKYDTICRYFVSIHQKKIVRTIGLMYNLTKFHLITYNPNGIYFLKMDFHYFEIVMRLWYLNVYIKMTQDVHHNFAEAGNPRANPIIQHGTVCLVRNFLGQPGSWSRQSPTLYWKQIAV